jgi:hypothetical protein
MFPYQNFPYISRFPSPVLSTFPGHRTLPNFSAPMYINQTVPCSVIPQNVHLLQKFSRELSLKCLKCVISFTKQSCRILHAYETSGNTVALNLMLSVKARGGYLLPETGPMLRQGSSRNVPPHPEGQDEIPTDFLVLLLRHSRQIPLRIQRKL